MHHDTCEQTTPCLGRLISTCSLQVCHVTCACIPEHYSTWNAQPNLTAHAGGKRRHMHLVCKYARLLQCCDYECHLHCDCSAQEYKHLRVWPQAVAASGEAIDMEACFSQLTLDVIGKAVFNYEFNSLTTNSPVIQVGGVQARRHTVHNQSQLMFATTATRLMWTYQTILLLSSLIVQCTTKWSCKRHRGCSMPLVSPRVSATVYCWYLTVYTHCC